MTKRLFSAVVGGGDLSLKTFLRKLHANENVYDVQFGETRLHEATKRDELPMKLWIIDLGSFTVEARDPDEASEKAQAMLASGEVTPEIANVVEDDLANDEPEEITVKEPCTLCGKLNCVHN